MYQPRISEIGVEDRTWLENERQKAWNAGDATRAHRCSGALNGDAAELGALREGKPSPDPDIAVARSL